MKHFIVLDLEWNQSPGGKDGSLDRLPFEIIEIGAVKLDEELQIVSEFHRLVRPRVYRQMHYKIKEVTHMSIEVLEAEGLEFEQAADEFISWCGEDYRLCTWGSMDLTELQRNMVYHGMELPFQMPLLYHDLQKLYGLMKGDRSKESLDAAVQELGILTDRPFHRALDDAYYTGRVMSRMDFFRYEPYVSVDYYRLPCCPQEEIYLDFPDYSKYVSMPYESKEELLLEKRITDVICYQCRRMLRKRIRWFPANQRCYICLAWCPEHGLLKGKLRIKRTDDGRLFAVRTCKLVNEEGAALVALRRDEAKLRRSGRNEAKKKARHPVA